MVRIFARTEWYMACSVSEELWEGVLEEQRRAIGPANRPSLTHRLVTKEGDIPVYAAKVERELEPFVGHRVLVHGKLVDLGEEGFGKELWIGTIEMGVEQS
jgi:hypothetical protein